MCTYIRAGENDLRLVGFRCDTDTVPTQHVWDWTCATVQSIAPKQLSFNYTRAFKLD